MGRDRKVTLAGPRRVDRPRRRPRCRRHSNRVQRRLPELPVGLASAVACARARVPKSKRPLVQRDGACLVGAHRIEGLTPRAAFRPSGHCQWLFGRPTCFSDMWQWRLARISHQAACRRQKAHGFHEVDRDADDRADCGLRWPRPRGSFGPVRAHAPSTVVPAMLSVASTRTEPKSSAIITAPGEKCGLAKTLAASC